MRYTILIVDDEQMLLELLSEVLSGQYEVLVANRIADAIALLEQRTVHLLVTDLNCGIDNGLDLLHWIGRHRAELLARSFILSGSYGPDMEGFGVPIIEKPIDLTQLQVRLASALNHLEEPQA